MEKHKETYRDAGAPPMTEVAIKERASEATKTARVRERECMRGSVSGCERARETSGQEERKKRSPQKKDEAKKKRSFACALMGQRDSCFQ